MSKFWVIFVREYLNIVKKKAFLAGVILTPLIMIAFMVLPSLLGDLDLSEAESIAVIDFSGQKVGEQFIEAIKEYDLDDDNNPAYSNLSLIEIDYFDSSSFIAAKDSLNEMVIDEELKFLLVIENDSTRQPSSTSLITNSDNFPSIRRFERELTAIISGIKLNHAKINLPVDSVLSLTERIDLEIVNTTGDSVNPRTKLIFAFTSIMILFMTLMTYGQLLMRSIIEEKNSRIMEVLISSVSPFQLMMGKIVGFGAATLTQVMIWILMGSVLSLFGSMFSAELSLGQILFNPVIIIFYVLLLVFGFFLFSTFFALLGALFDSDKDAQNFLLPITLLLMVPILLSGPIIREPDSTLAIVLSMIPVFAPTMMTMRIVLIVPTLAEYSLFSGIIGQAIVSLVILIITTIGMIWLVGKIFRVGILMYGKRPTLPEIVKWVKQ